MCSLQCTALVSCYVHIAQRAWRTWGHLSRVHGQLAAQSWSREPMPVRVLVGCLPAFGWDGSFHSESSVGRGETMI